MKKFLIFWFPVVVYSGIIFLVSSFPRVPIPRGIPFADKICHIVEYGLFGFLAVRGFQKTFPLRSAKNLFIWALLLVFFQGISDEFHQSFVDGRSASIMDALADLVGGAVGILLFLKINEAGRLSRRCP